MSEPDISTLGSLRLIELPAVGPLLRTEQDALDIIGMTFGWDVDLLVLPVSRLDADLFTLSNGLLGAMIQKFTNYRLRIAVIGDISSQVTASDALRDFVHEANSGKSILFAESTDALKA